MDIDALLLPILVTPLHRLRQW